MQSSWIFVWEISILLIIWRFAQWQSYLNCVVHMQLEANINLRNCSALGLASWKCTSNGKIKRRNGNSGSNNTRNCALWRHLPVWWAIDIWIGHGEHCMQHFHFDHRSPLWHRRCPNRAAHFSISTSMPNCHEPFRQYLVAFLLSAMNSRWFLLLMHNLFANCYLPWNFQMKSTTKWIFILSKFFFCWYFDIL